MPWWKKPHIFLNIWRLRIQLKIQNTINCLVICSLDVFLCFSLKYFLFDTMKKWFCSTIICIQMNVGMKWSTIILKHMLPTSFANKKILHQHYSLHLVVSAPFCQSCVFTFLVTTGSLFASTLAVQRKDERRYNKVRFWNYSLMWGHIQSSFCFLQSAPVFYKRTRNKSSFKCRIITIHILSKWLNELFKSGRSHMGSKGTFGFRNSFSLNISLFKSSYTCTSVADAI